ncbi:MAG: aminotransferase class I/II-fold pyridoxal phosphate-dependent enzyme [Phycisphaerales bacterium]|jgi:aspartate/methionine/tyrosine aminotransferase|nr:aminotransferase class I/II-fold pyridoxal phosphate-dependent enzyme [Phycisphaerales bacterium]
MSGTAAISLSARVDSLKASSTVAVMNKAKALKAAGVDVLNFSAGEPDFNTPQPAKAAAIAAINANATKYIDTAGDVPTRELLAKLLTERNKIPNVTKDHVLVTAGVKMALYLAYQALFDVPTVPGQPQQEMLLPVPAWVSFNPMAVLAGAKVIELPTTPEADFKLTAAQLKAAITPRTRAVMLNSPSNPCSTMYSRQELAAIAAVIAEAARTIAPQIVVISDELYQNIVFGTDASGRPAEHVSIGSFPDIAERTITINGPGKSFAMTGWRLGWLSGSGEFGKRFIAGLTKLQGQSITCVSGFSLAAMRSALTECDAELEMMRKAFASRASLFTGLLRQIPGLKLANPVGAFYVFPDISAHLGKSTPKGAVIASAADFAAALLDEHHMAVVPGEDFSQATGHKHIRMSFACDEAQLRAGAERLGRFVASLK